MSLNYSFIQLYLVSKLKKSTKRFTNYSFIQLFSPSINICWAVREPHWVESANWTKNNYTSDFWHHIFSQSLNALVLCVISLIGCSTSILPTNGDFNWHLTGLNMISLQVRASQHPQFITTLLLLPSIQTRLWYHFWVVRRSLTELDQHIE
jgi:hypothetical protein